MKASRLMSALMLLQAHGQLSTRELAERLEVSQRTVHRDMEALCIAGIPLLAMRGAQGGWRLEKGWRTQVPGLDEPELRALLMTQPRALGDPKLSAAAERAFGKLMAALPVSMRRQAEAMRERLHVDHTGWHPSSEDLSMLPLVQDAVARDCRLTFDYTRADGDTAPRTVDPLGLVAKGSTWYMVGRAANGLRTYRVSRMQAVTVLATSFERPAKFSLGAYWSESTAQLQQARQSYEVTLLLDPQAARSIGQWMHAVPVKPGATKLPEGWSALRVGFENEHQARFVTLGFGPKARVLEPKQLRERVLADARAIAAAGTANTLPG
ncbi:helix-turn-helix transcriptional regulator [Edaphobacter dinghuensis]|uniref:Transcriptional regulator n=1 Tax=Edaphobacter dinghuensis TaxID=1560005 RepID=A0A917LXI1_9BACT|nr:YafY family protein [Edaphobacter dinghuensis]GGG63718.1 transcriptional regulator [Edaphobacter dinghuensis]